MKCSLCRRFSFGMPFFVPHPEVNKAAAKATTEEKKKKIVESKSNMYNNTVKIYANVVSLWLHCHI